MCNRRLARRLLCLFVPFCALPGCQMFHGDPTVAVLVRDAETKKPIATAEVYLCQRLPKDEIAPCRAKGLTQSDGIARLHADTTAERGLQVQTIAQGYLRKKVDLSADEVKKIALVSLTQKAAQRPADVVVDVYAEPNFSVELVLPAGYRGLVKVDVQIQDNLPLPAGQRCFRYPVSASGDVVVHGPSLLQRVSAPEFRARYGNGPLLGAALDGEKVGFRWIKSMGNRQFFVVGTQLDYEALHRRIAPEETRPMFGSGDDATLAVKSNKYRYGHITAKNYEK